MKTVLLFLFLTATQTGMEKVIICTGANSHVYHKTTNCHGLTGCHWHTDMVSVDSAVILGRTPCKLCYRQK